MTNKTPDLLTSHRLRDLTLNMKYRTIYALNLLHQHYDLTEHTPHEFAHELSKLKTFADIEKEIITILEANPLPSSQILPQYLQFNNKNDD